MFITTYTNNTLGDPDFAVTYYTSNQKDKPLVDVVNAFISSGETYK